MIVTLDPGGTVEAEHATGALFGQLQLAPPEFANATETKVVPVGVTSLKLLDPQLLGPLFVMTCV